MPEARGGRRIDKGHKRILVGGGGRCEGTVDSNGCMTVSEFTEMYIKMMNFTLCKIYLSTLALKNNGRSKRYGHNNSLILVC